MSPASRLEDRQTAVDIVQLAVSAISIGLQDAAPGGKMLPWMFARAEAGAMKTWLLLLAAPMVWFAHFSTLRDRLFRGPHQTVAWTLTGLACLAVASVWFAAGILFQGSFLGRTGGSFRSLFSRMSGLLLAIYQLM